MRPVSGVGNVSEPVDNLEVPPASGYIAVVWRQMLLDDLSTNSHVFPLNTDSIRGLGRIRHRRICSF